MKLSIRKCYALQKSLEALIENAKLNIVLNEFEDPEKLLAEAKNKFTECDKRNEMLLKAIYSIRTFIGQANHFSGINDLLTKGAFLDHRIATVSKYAELPPTLSLDVIKGKLEKLKNMDTGSASHYYNDEISTYVLDQKMIDFYRETLKVLKKQKQQINDEVLEKNVKYEIELPPDVVELLRIEDLV